MILVPKGNAAGALLVTPATAQTSPVTGTPKLTLVAAQPALAVTTTSAGQVIVGMDGSCTMTSCWQVATFPTLSTAVQVTTLVPDGKVFGALLVRIATPEQLSEVTGVPNATFVAEHPEFAVTVTSPGQVIMRGV